MTTNVELSIADRVARVTLRNERGIQLLTADTRRQINGVLDELERHDGCAVVLFQADGPTFIAGADINELRALTAETAEAMARDGQQLMTRIARLNALTVAAVHAACAGGGCELALACDFRLAATKAKMGLPEVSLGILPGWGGTVRIARLFGGATARRLILTGELLSAQELLHLGVVDALVPDDQFRDAVDTFIAKLLTRGPQACATAKRLIAEFEGPPLDDQLQAEAVAFAACYATGEAAEGCAAFLEKRAAVWPVDAAHRAADD